ncbi:hypothetical protein [Micromonospora echinofusca]|uniref:hypothetical protein n=1 Tax=Micromonospora echinofusca TaxID=47858 RepID=UPI0033F1C033
MSSPRHRVARLLRRLTVGVRTKGRPAPPAGADQPLRLDAFKPVDPDAHLPRDAEAARERVIALVSQMQPRGTDEGTGHALDKMIDDWADRWLAEIEPERLNALTVVDALVGQVTPDELRLRMSCEAAGRRFERARRDHDLAYRLLGGEAIAAVQPRREEV